MTTKTCTILIGNSDDKLTQSRWNRFYRDIYDIVFLNSKEIHFFGSSYGVEPWQNACWVFEVDYKNIETMKEELIRTRKEFKQDSVAIVFGKTNFI